MRLALSSTLGLGLALLAPAAAAQPVERPCRPRVEAGATVPAPTVARLTAAVSNDRSGECPTVRLELINSRLVMTVVLGDGRQVARVLPSLNDALPTLIALTATPALPAATPVPPADAAPADAPPAPAPAAAPPAVPPAVVVAVPVPPVTTAPVVATRAWRLRLGAAYGGERARGASADQVATDVELVLPRWVFGARVSFAFAGHGDRETWNTASALTAARRWNTGRWEFDLGALVGARWAFGADTVAGFSMRAAPEASVGFTLGRGVSLFVRLDAGVELSRAEGTTRGTNNRGTPSHAPWSAEFVGDAAAGVRWVIP